MVQLMPMPPRHLLLQQNSEWFTFLVPAYPGCPGKKGRQMDVVVVVVVVVVQHCLWFNNTNNQLESIDKQTNSTHSSLHWYGNKITESQRFWGKSSQKHTYVRDWSQTAVNCGCDWPRTLSSLWASERLSTYVTRMSNINMSTSDDSSLSHIHRHTARQTFNDRLTIVTH